ncbi:uncharacterized protein LY89DRAFT_761313 [Mollisia scopiformis]|uniref:Uncharacterized protein n=1 Tax=Mollisia scopiformis TaxID=149040 RepID=A0A132BCG0_MOLSC|nr:uncharacterized protein LY89DRAFT_761313 [Mollisia scopiformis]KUJ09689.1 hypothetical protein LY89DRAFT_761313 [Mollisia scopiformis]
MEQQLMTIEVAKKLIAAEDKMQTLRKSIDTRYGGARIGLNIDDDIISMLDPKRKALEKVWQLNLARARYLVAQPQETVMIASVESEAERNKAKAEDPRMSLEMAHGFIAEEHNVEAAKNALVRRYGVVARDRYGEATSRLSPKYRALEIVRRQNVKNARCLVAHPQETVMVSTIESETDTEEKRILFNKLCQGFWLSAQMDIRASGNF